MTYAAQQDLIDRFGEQELVELTDVNGLGVLDSVAVSRALSDADAEINSYLAGRYTLPVTQVSGELMRLACDIARYRLWDTKATDQILARYSDAISKLRDISKGVASLGVDQLNHAVPNTGGGVQVSSPGRVFSDDALGGY